MHPVTYVGLLVCGSMLAYLIRIMSQVLTEVKRMADHRYHLQHGRRGGYCVVDMSTRGKVVMFASGSKRECVTEAQRLNGFKLIDGKEETYLKQISKEKD